MVDIYIIIFLYENDNEVFCLDYMEVEFFLEIGVKILIKNNI